MYQVSSVLHDVQCVNVQCTMFECGGRFFVWFGKQQERRQETREESSLVTVFLSRVFVRLVAQFQTPKIKKGKTWKT